jgi:hypothetical protein
VIDLAEAQERSDLGLVGRTLAAVQRLNLIMETRNCDEQVALAELAESERVDARIIRAMTAATADGRA